MRRARLMRSSNNPRNATRQSKLRHDRSRSACLNVAPGMRSMTYHGTVVWKRGLTQPHEISEFSLRGRAQAEPVLDLLQHLPDDSSMVDSVDADDLGLLSAGRTGERMSFEDIRVAGVV